MFNPLANVCCSRFDRIRIRDLFFHTNRWTFSSFLSPFVLFFYGKIFYFSKDYFSVFLFSTARTDCITRIWNYSNLMSCCLLLLKFLIHLDQLKLWAFRNTAKIKLNLPLFFLNSIRFVETFPFEFLFTSSSEFWFLIHTQKIFTVLREEEKLEIIQKMAKKNSRESKTNDWLGTQMKQYWS